MKEHEAGHATTLRKEAALAREKAKSAGYAERQTLLLLARTLDDMADSQEKWRRRLMPSMSVREAWLQAQRLDRGSSSGRDKYTDDWDVRPREVEQFQLLWFVGVIASSAYDVAVAAVGAHLEVAVDMVLLVTAVSLMHYAVRRRSNLARLLLIPYLLVTFVEVFSHTGYAANIAETCLAMLQLGLMVGAVGLLFTPSARGWYLRGADRI